MPILDYVYIDRPAVIKTDVLNIAFVAVAFQYC